MQVLFYFLWDHWAHPGYFENRIPLKPALGSVCSLSNYSVSYEETQSNRVSDFRDFVCSLFPKAILFWLLFSTIWAMKYLFNIHVLNKTATYVYVEIHKMLNFPSICSGDWNICAGEVPDLPGQVDQCSLSPYRRFWCLATHREPSEAQIRLRRSAVWSDLRWAQMQSCRNCRAPAQT